ncbi:MAG TPA: class I SAM-dependent methyltransferase [Rhizomicrobium sp.]|nr:class I SAM-dependent methyltransferase [Rhizomicrobium sp.]
MNNQDQIEYWNGRAGQNWAAQQDYTDRILGHITEAFLAFAAPKAGERVLDIGCGCGTTTFTFAQCVGRDGSVAGIDISGPMLSVAQARAQASQADIPFIEADASTYDFQPVFDLVASRFGVMFFAEPVGAFANIRKALAPNGRLAFVCWRAMQDNGWAMTPIAAARPLLPPQEPIDPNAPGPFAFADKDRLRDILEKAGFRHIHIEKFDGHMDMAATVEEAAAKTMTIGPLSRATAEVDEATRTKIRDAVMGALKSYATPEGVRAPVACWLVRARP